MRAFSGMQGWLNLLLAAWICTSFQRSNDKIALKNPSFEDTPGSSRVPPGWLTVGMGSTPDVMPGAWGVRVPPQDGLSFLALVTREDGSCEDIAQHLTTPLKPNVCYEFDIYLAHTHRYVGYNLPVRVRVWGSDGPNKRQLLCSSSAITHADWRRYTFQFVPNHTMRYIILEAYYAPGVFRHYRGNVLLDNCSPIKRCERA